MKKIWLVKFVFLITVFASLPAFSAEHSAASYEAVNECHAQLNQKFPSLEAIKQQFVDQLERQEEVLPSPHDAATELCYGYMAGPGININTLGYESDGETYFFLTLVEVEKAGLVDFSGLDIGSSRTDVTKKFGEPHSVKGKELHYGDEEGYIDISFTVEKDKVVKMTFCTYPD